MTVQDIEVGLNRSTTRPCSTWEKALIMLVEVDLYLGPALLPPIIHVSIVDHLIFIVMVIT